MAVPHSLAHIDVAVARTGQWYAPMNSPGIVAPQGETAHGFKFWDP